MGPTADDQAFLRAIVASPGDDLPRLAYADFLDERNDRRGAYLRAEVAWAAPWRDGHRPGDDAAVRGLAAGLDPVWVARVSRPPAGVCCDHVRFTGSGPPLAAGHLALAEKRLGRPLPPELAAFLLDHNGGVPSRPRLPHPDEPNDIEFFGHLGPPAGVRDDTRYFRAHLGLPTEWLLFASPVADGDVILISTAPDRAGAIYYWWHITPGYDPERVRLIYPSVGRLLADLTDRPPDEDFDDDEG